MTSAELTLIQLRLQKAMSDRDTWRATGDTERYLEAYCMVEALERQLDDSLDQRPRDGAAPH